MSKNCTYVHIICTIHMVVNKMEGKLITCCTLGLIKKGSPFCVVSVLVKDPLVGGYCVPFA